jgi:tetratricopeptide (TPR) repeat protein
MRALAFLLLALAWGCSSAPPKQASTAARQEAAIEANRKGESYVRHGELDNAARSYTEALRLSQSLEDADGIAANAINLSIVRQRQGRFNDARESLGAVLEQPNLRFAPARLAEVSLRHALLDLDQNRLPEAGDWVKQAAAHCGAGCPASSAIQNTRAQIALRAGRVEEAEAAARAALGASRAAEDRAELANALRLLGIASLHKGEAAAARAHLEQALALDREIGAPRKIALDLLALGRAASIAGERDTARSFYARALAVAQADRDDPGAAEARALLIELDKPAAAAATGK